MKTSILLLSLTIVVFSSCTTAYKSTQTPDDVYYSPTRPLQDDKQVRNQEDQYYTDDYYSDRYLHMKVHDRMLWSSLDDWYNFDRYSFGYYNWNDFYYNPYVSWNYYYNPYCCCHTNNYTIIKSMAVNQPRMFDLQTYSYRPSSTNNSKMKGFGSSSNSYSNSTYSPSGNSSANNGSNTGSFLRNIFSGHNSSSGSGSGSHTSSSSGGSHSSSSAPVRKF